MSILKRRGPKEKPDREKKVVIRIWVKKKYHAKARSEAQVIERKYDTAKSTAGL